MDNHLGRHMIPALRLFWSLAASFGLLAWLYSAAGQQSWYRQHPSILRRVFPRRFHRLGALDDLPLRIANPDTTAVVLNWSRLPNVLRISSLLCSPALEGVISEVFIWNNNPNPITFRVRTSGPLLLEMKEQPMTTRSLVSGFCWDGLSRIQTQDP